MSVGDLFGFSGGALRGHRLQAADLDAVLLGLLDLVGLGAGQAERRGEPQDVALRHRPADHALGQ